MEKTKDILSELGKMKNGKILVGFAVETSNLEEYAKSKLLSKNLDMIVANDVSAMGNEKNSIVIFKSDGTSKRVGLDEKERIAFAVLDELSAIWSRS